jgi:hypothetical protein
MIKRLWNDRRGEGQSRLHYDCSLRPHASDRQDVSKSIKGSNLLKLAQTEPETKMKKTLMITAMAVASLALGGIVTVRAEVEKAQTPTTEWWILKKSTEWANPDSCLEAKNALSSPDANEAFSSPATAYNFFLEANSIGISNVKIDEHDGEVTVWYDRADEPQLTHWVKYYRTKAACESRRRGAEDIKLDKYR